jgi:hypothetical protein
MPGRFASESVADLDRNGWPIWNGISGRFGAESPILDQNILNIICFGKTQYDLISNYSTTHDRYISILNEGKIIQDKALFSKKISVYLTYPTGWRFVKNYKFLKNVGLKLILDFIFAHSGRKI